MKLHMNKGHLKCASKIFKAYWFQECFARAPDERGRGMCMCVNHSESTGPFASEPLIRKLYNTCRNLKTRIRKYRTYIDGFRPSPPPSLRQIGGIGSIRKPKRLPGLCLQVVEPTPLLLWTFSTESTKRLRQVALEEIPLQSGRLFGFWGLQLHGHGLFKTQIG